MKIVWRRCRTTEGRAYFRPVWQRYLKSDGTTGYRPKTRWPQWYRIERVREGELLGSLHEERVRCGKPTCRCASGRRAEAHAAFYRRWRDDGGTPRKAYVRKRDVAAVREAIEQRRVRLAEERDARERHMGRGPYSWAARHPEEAAARKEQYAALLLGAVRELSALLEARRARLGARMAGGET